MAPPAFRSACLLQAPREDVLVVRQRQLEKDVYRLTACKPRRGNLEYTVFLRHSLYIGVVGGDGELCVLDRFTRLEMLEKDGEALPSRQNSYQLIARGHRDDARGHWQVERCRRVMIVPLVRRNSVQNEKLYPTEDQHSQSNTRGAAPNLAQAPDGFRPIFLGHRLSRLVSQ